MKLTNSQFTKEFLRLAWNHYGTLGLFWGNLVLLTSCYVIAPEKFLLMKWGYSGSGKTISDKVALFFLQPKEGGVRPAEGEDEIPYLIISSRLTPAGLGKLFKEHRLEARNFLNANLIMYEDLSRATTRYLQKTTIGFLASLTESKKLDDITSQGAGLGVRISKKKKKCMLSGTPSQLDYLTGQDIYTEYIDRRSLSVFVLLNDAEWRERIRRAKAGYFKREDENIVKEWENMICEAYRNSGIKKGLAAPNKLIDLKSPYRKTVYKRMLRFKKFPENLMIMIDAIAKGHAMLNGRNCTINEDYEVIDKLFSRFIYLGNVRKKEFLIMEEILRNRSGKGIRLEDLAKILRVRSYRTDLPDAKMVIKTIRNYVQISKNLEIKNGYIDISMYLKILIKEWEKQVKEVIR